MATEIAIMCMCILLRLNEVSQQDPFSCLPPDPEMGKKEASKKKSWLHIQ